MPKLKDLCTKASSNIRQSDLESRDGDYPVYGAVGFIKNVDFYTQEKPYVAVVKDGAGVGRVMYLPAFSSVIGTMQYIIPNTGTNARYLAYAMDFLDLSRYHMGATIPHIYFKDYREEELPFHSEQEQNYIASVLERIDGLICLRQQQLVKLDELLKARFIEMFGDPIVNPFKWSTAQLSNHLSIIGGYAFRSDTFKTSGIPVIRIGNINSGHFMPVNMVYWDNDSNLQRYKIYPGDLVMSLTGTVGKDDYGNVCMLGNDYPEYYLNQRNAKLSLFPTINKYYLMELLKYPAIKTKLTGLNRGIRQANIANKDILTLRIAVPPIEQQERFAAFVARSDKAKSEIRRGLEKMRTLKKASMREFFG